MATTERQLIERALQTHSLLIAAGVHPEWARLQVLDRTDSLNEGILSPEDVADEIEKATPDDFRVSAESESAQEKPGNEWDAKKERYRSMREAEKPSPPIEERLGMDQYDPVAAGRAMAERKKTDPLAFQ